MTRLRSDRLTMQARKKMQNQAINSNTRQSDSLSTSSRKLRPRCVFCFSRWSVCERCRLVCRPPWRVRWAVSWPFPSCFPATRRGPTLVAAAWSACLCRRAAAQSPRVPCPALLPVFLDAIVPGAGKLSAPL